MADRVYTSAEYEAVAREYEDPGSLIASALFIASRVQAEGVIEMACGLLAGLPPEEVDTEQWRVEANVIRSVLMTPGDSGKAMLPGNIDADGVR